MSQPLRSDFRLMHRLRVRWAEVDQQRIVFNPHYLMYIDTAFTDYWRDLAIAYEAIPALLGGDMYVKKSTLEYHGSARLDELIDVGVRCERIGNTSLRFVAGIFRADTLLVTGELVYVFADPATQTSTPVPDQLRALITDYEAGRAVTETLVGTWSSLGPQASALRHAVFVEELEIPLALEQDMADQDALHVVLRNRMGQVVGTGRLIAQGQGESRIGRVAVSRSMRSNGHGRSVLRALVQAAAERGDQRVVLSAKQSAQSFYTRLGFATVGQPFMEAGVLHVEMAQAFQKTGSGNAG